MFAESRNPRHRGISRFLSSPLAPHAALAVCLFSQAPTIAQTYPEYVHIDFSRLPDGTPLTEGTELSNQFAAYGIAFSMNDGGAGLPIIAQEGEPMVAFWGANGADSPMRASAFGLSDPVGVGGDVTVFRPIRIDFQPPVTGVRLFGRHPGGQASQNIGVRFIHQDGQNPFGNGCGNPEVQRYVRFANQNPQGSAIVSARYLCNNCANPVLGFAICDLAFIRAAEQPLLGPFVRVAQESTPGVADFDHNVIGVIRAWRSPSNLAPRAEDFYFYGHEFSNAVSFGGLLRGQLQPSQSHLILADTMQGLTLFCVYDRTEGGGGNGCLPDPPAGDAGGHAEMRIQFAGLAGLLANIVQDDLPGGNPPDEYSLEQAGDSATFTAYNGWEPTNTDGFSLSGLSGSWSAQLAFSEIADPQTPPVTGLTTWVAMSSDGPDIPLAVAVDRRVQLKTIDACLAVSAPVSVASCPGGSLALNALAVTTYSGGSISYQWRKNENPITDEPGHISGSNSATLIITQFVPADFGNYDVIATNACGTTISAAAVISAFAGIPGDVNSNGQVNGGDIQPFVNVLISGDRTSPAFCAADMDQSGEVNTPDVPLFTSSLLD